MMRLAFLIQLAGVAGVAVGLGMFAPWLGVTAAGVGLILFGLALERPNSEPS